MRGAQTNRRGRDNQEIAAQLHLSEKTVKKTHVGNILLKPGLKDRTQAAIYALKATTGW
ncbi:response regulator transcription factor [Roseiflexus sp.]